MTKTQAACLGLFLPLFMGCASDVKVGVFNAPPAADILVPADGSSVVEGDTVEITGSASDSDGAAESLTVEWTVDGDAVCPPAKVTHPATLYQGIGPHKAIREAQAKLDFRLGQPPDSNA